MLGCFGCTRCGCYKDHDEIRYFNGQGGGKTTRGTTGLNNSGSDDGEGQTVRETERNAALTLGGPKMEI